MRTMSVAYNLDPFLQSKLLYGPLLTTGAIRPIVFVPDAKFRHRIHSKRTLAYDKNNTTTLSTTNAAQIRARVRPVSYTHLTLPTTPYV